MLYALLCVTLCSFWFYNHRDGEERAGYFTWFVFLVPHDCYVAILRGAMGLSAVCDCVFSDHTHLLFLNTGPIRIKKIIRNFFLALFVLLR